jgi:hypothetical protein
MKGLLLSAALLAMLTISRAQTLDHGAIAGAWHMEYFSQDSMSFYPDDPHKPLVHLIMYPDSPARNITSFMDIFKDEKFDFPLDSMIVINAMNWIMEGYLPLDIDFKPSGVYTAVRRFDRDSDDGSPIEEMGQYLWQENNILQINTIQSRFFKVQSIDAKRLVLVLKDDGNIKLVYRR